VITLDRRFVAEVLKVFGKLRLGDSQALLERAQALPAVPLITVANISRRSNPINRTQLKGMKEVIN
jgi:hypothetical protein